jgi:hypothetical protein
MRKFEQAKIHAKIHRDGDVRGQPTTTACVEKSSFGGGFPQNGEHDPL